MYLEKCVNESLKSLKEAVRSSLMAPRGADHERLKENEENIIKNWKQRNYWYLMAELLATL